MDTLSPPRTAVARIALKANEAELYDSLKRLEAWVESHNYEAYEPFDCLSSPFRRVTQHS
jgi:hypothetical protein